MSMIGRGKGHLPQYSVEEDDEENPHYLCVSCHDWACNCLSPRTIKRYTLKQYDTGPALGPTMYARGFVLPKGVHWDRKNRLVTDTHLTGENKPTNTDTTKHGHKTRPKARLEDIMKGLIPMKNSKKAEMQLEENRKRRQVEQVLSCKPVSVKGAFRISVPHWQNRGHTQRWVWDNKVQCQLWSSRDKYLRVAAPAVHASKLHTLNTAP